MKTLDDFARYIEKTAITRLIRNTMSDTALDMYTIALHYIYGGAY